MQSKAHEPQFQTIKNNNQCNPPSSITDVKMAYVRAAGAPVLVSSPFQHELGQLRMERLRLEESHLLEVRRQEQLESMRYPLPKWSVVIVPPPTPVFNICLALELDLDYSFIKMNDKQSYFTFNNYMFKEHFCFAKGFAFYICNDICSSIRQQS